MIRLDLEHRLLRLGSRLLLLLVQVELHLTPMRLERVPNDLAEQQRGAHVDRLSGTAERGDGG